MSGESRGAWGPGFVTGLIAGLVLATLVGIGVGILDEDERSPTAEAFETIEANYFEEVAPERLQQDSIRGLIDALRKRYDDRFSHYFSPKQFDLFQTHTSGRFNGVGMAVNEVPRGLRVARVYEDTPAERAGIDVGAVITAVDGRSIAGVPSDVATARIKGPPGTEVELRLDPPGGGKARVVSVERASVRLPAVGGDLRRAAGNKVAHVHIATFSAGVHGDLRDELERLYREGAEGLVLDLRGNGGGLLNEAVLTSSVFVENGVVVSTRSRSRGQREYEAVGEALDPRPTVVLVDRDTASAAEILAAALEDFELGTVVGTRTFGKGTFQEVIPLESGGAVDLTVGQYLTAAGESLADKGIRPEIRAEDDPESEQRDEALEEALAVLARKLDAGDE